MNIVLHITTEEALRSSWIASSIEAYIEWLEGRHAARSTIVRRVTHLVQFGTFAREQGARDTVDLCAHVTAFVGWRVAASEKERSSARWTE